MIGITPKMRRQVEKASAEPLRLTDPETNDAYNLLKEEGFDRARDVVHPRSVADQVVPEGTFRSRQSSSAISSS